MASLLNRVWSGLDFWDKEENRKQRQQFAQPQPQPQQSPVRQVTNVGRKFVEGATESPTQLGRGFAYGFSPDVKAAQKAANSAVSSQADLMARARQRLNDPMVSVVEKQRWQKFIQRQQPNVANTSKIAVDLANKAVKETNPIRMGAATADTAFTALTAPVAVTGAAAAKTAGKQAIQAGGKYVLPRAAVATAKPLVNAGAKSALLTAPSGALGTLVNNPNATAQQIAQNAAVSGGIGFAMPTAGYVGSVVAKPVVRATGKGVARAVQKASPAVRQTATTVKNAASLETPDTFALRQTNRLLQKQFERSPDPRVRNAAAKQIALNNQEINKIKQGGYVKVGSESGMLPNAEARVFAQNPVSGKPVLNALPEQKVNIQKRQSARNVPVRTVSKQGDTIIKTNVNKNIKAKEMRYSLSEDGQLLPDAKGAYRIFKDSEGHVTHFRVGDKVYSADKLGDLSSVNTKGSSLATQRRNLERAFDDKATGQKVSQFLVDEQQSSATKMINRQAEFKAGTDALAKDLGIKFDGLNRGKAKKVSAAIQDYGEKARTKQSLVDEFGKEYADKIVKADKWFRGQYDALIDEANNTLTKYGYDPIPKRKNYYTHFQDPGFWSTVGLKMQEFRNFASPTMQDALASPARGKISNQLAGMSEFTTPNKRFNPFALQRTGAEHTSDAFQAFERYLNPTLNNIYMTPSITKARVLTRVIADEADLAGKDANHIIVQTREWANRLAGKTSRIDRPLVDSDWGSKGLKTMQFLQRRAGANTIVGNVATAVKQPIVLAQTIGKFGYKNTLVAVAQELSTAHTKKAPIRASEFMRRRYANLAPTTRTRIQRGADVANTPLKVVEETSARITWNSAYNDALSKGMQGKAAIKYADVQAEKTLAGRSIGERPEMFEAKAPGLMTMYQLEVNNYIQQVGKEMTPAQVARTFTAAFALNLMFEKLTGTSIGFNPIGAGVDTVKEAYKDEKPTSDKLKTVGQRWAGEVVDNTPFAAAGLNTLLGDKGLKAVTGKDSNTGRFGFSSPVTALWNNPTNLVTPFGGSQIKKTIGGIKAVSEGQLTDKNGNVTVNVPQTTGNMVQGTIFGKGAIPEVKTYYDNLGKKKVDQVTVPNQTNSKAAKMGGINNGQMTASASAATKGPVTEDQQKELIRNAFSTKQGRAMLALNDDEKKAWAQESPENRALYDRYRAMKDVYASTRKGYELPTSLSKEQTSRITNFKRKEDGFSDNGKATWYKKAPDTNGAGLYKEANSLLPSGFEPLPNTNKTVSNYNKYLSDIAGAKTNIAKADIQKEFMRNSYKDGLSDNAKVFFSGSTYNNDQKIAALESGDISKADFEAAIALDNYLYDKGLSTSLSISKTLRSKFGYGTPSSRSGRRSGRSSKTSQLAAVNAAIAAQKKGNGDKIYKASTPPSAGSSKTTTMNKTQLKKYGVQRKSVNLNKLAKLV